MPLRNNSLRGLCTITVVGTKKLVGFYESQSGEAHVVLFSGVSDCMEEKSSLFNSYVILLREYSTRNMVPRDIAGINP